MTLNLAPFGRWTLRDKAAQRRLALRWAWLRRVLICRENPAFRQSIKSVERIGADYAVEEETSGSYTSALQITRRILSTALPRLSPQPLRGVSAKSIACQPNPALKRTR